MNYTAEILGFDQEVEASVSLCINGKELVCFCNMLPAGLVVGMRCEVELLPMVFGEYAVVELPIDKPASIERVGDSFSHVVTGCLNGTHLNVGNLVFEDEVLLRDFGYLDGRMVAWRIERLDVEIFGVA